LLTPNKFDLAFQMAHTKQTARKSTGGRVPRHQLAPRNGQAEPEIQNPSEWLDIPRPLAGDFGPLLQQALERVGATEEPEYIARHVTRDGVGQWQVMVLLPAARRFPDAEPWTVRIFGDEQTETVTRAAQQALTELTERYHGFLLRPFGHLPVRDQSNPHWRRRVENLGDPSHATYAPDSAVMARYARAAFNLQHLTEMRSQYRAKTIKELTAKLGEKDRKIRLLSMRDREYKTANNELHEQVQHLQHERATHLAQLQQLQEESAALIAQHQHLFEMNTGLLNHLQQAADTIQDLENQIADLEEDPEEIVPMEEDSEIED
jgi:hypothetical protein